MRYFLSPLFFLMMFQLSGQESLITSLKDLSEKLSTLASTLKKMPVIKQTKIPVYLHPNQAAASIFENLKKEIGTFDSEYSILDDKAEVKPAKKALVFINWVGNRFDLMLPPGAGIKKVIEKIIEPVFIVATVTKDPKSDFPRDMMKIIYEDAGKKVPEKFSEQRKSNIFGFTYNRKLQFNQIELDTDKFPELDYKKNVKDLQSYLFD